MGSVVPRPKFIEYHNRDVDYLEVDKIKLKVNNSIGDCWIVERALARYRSVYFFDDNGPEIKDDPHHSERKRVGQLDSIELVAGTGQATGFACESLPHANMDEAYNLTIKSLDQTSQPSYRAQLVANTSWGLLRALETLSQLIFNIKTTDSTGGGIYAISLVDIQDEPRFKYRGFMLDTARHFISVKNILKLLDSMAFNKLNVFHWHIVDDQSFPFVSATYPQVSKLNSFRPKLVYTKRDIQRVVLYAASRGIRVVAEFDTPGHSYALRHIPDLLTKCYDTQSKQPNGDFGPIDPTKPETYTTVSKLMADFNTVFVDEYVHAGGDEVDFDCWRSNPQVNSWMDGNNMTGNYKELSNYYMRKLHNMVKESNKSMLVWQEVFDMGAQLPKEDVIVQVWNYINDRPAYMAELSVVLKSGYRAILSSCWYLNYIDYGQDWIKFYQCEPAAKPVTTDDEHLIEGGEICMWTEYVDDTNVVSRTWPRASSAAERLWSPKEVVDVVEFLPRLEQHRCRLRARKIHAEPVVGPGYC